MTVTHPWHPLRGQRVEIVRLRRGLVPDLIVRAPDGLHIALAADWTDYATAAADARAPAPAHLLALDGLRRMADLIAGLRSEPPARLRGAAPR